MRRIGPNVPSLTVMALAAAGVLAVAGCSGRGERWTPPPGLAKPGADLARAEALALQAQRAEDNGHIEEAIRLYREAVAAYREFPAAWNNLGRLLMEQGDGLEAATALRVAADLSPSDPRPVYNLGMLWQQRGYMEEASRYYAQALERDENYLPALRESIYVDRHERNRIDEHIARRIRRAMLLETDPQWLAFFERQKILVEQDPASSPGPFLRGPLPR